MEEKSIGILAGMGPRSTAPFIDAVVDHCQKLYGATLDEEFPKMFILSLPTPFYINKAIDHDLMIQTIQKGLQELEQTGVDFIAMPCNSAHIYFDQLKEAIQIPLLNIIDETLGFLDPTKRTSLIGTQGTFDSQLYQSGIHVAEIEFLFQKSWQSQINEIIQLIKSGQIEQQAKSQWQELLKKLEAENIQQAIIACTDLNAVIDYSDQRFAFVDSTDALAQAVVKTYHR